MSKLANNLKDKVALDTEHQSLIRSLDATVANNLKEIAELKNLEKQHQYMNGQLHETITAKDKEIFQLKKDNEIFKEHLQAELLKKK
tara:strand:+ start:164 stop:424 length:261 start_codon:yes stop_codon:yes gene_type:complete